MRRLTPPTWVCDGEMLLLCRTGEGQSESAAMPLAWVLSPL